MIKEKIFTALLIVVLAVLSWHCSAPEQLYDYDTLADFSQYRTFSWLDAQPAGPQLDTFAAQAVRRAVEQALTRRGLEPVDRGGDLSVMYHVGDKAAINVPAAGYEYWPDRWSWGGYYQGASGFVFPRDALVVDLIDDEDEQLVWRGSAEAVFKQGSNEKIAGRINAAVEEIMSNFPSPGQQ
jgi:hypothetical protein